jgi:aryl-alcohol dehydrogenase-like predicted oxidoreductase
VDTLFWEPRYTTVTRFLRQRSHADVQVIAGSFHADRASLTHDLELTRKRLQRDTIDLFLLFWVRSAARLGPEALDALREFQARGWIRSYGFSTHDRAIGTAAIETGDWPVIMTRHSAAHDGAERELLPAASAAGVGVLGFSALCYGRMLEGSSVSPAGPSAPDCYRYSLSQPAVAACISAPQTHRELLENLAVLDEPHLDAAHQELLRAHGREVYADNLRFNRLLRRGGAAPLREAILELFDRPEDHPPEAHPEAHPKTQADKL